MTPKKWTPTQHALYNAIPKGGRVRYFGGYGGPHFAIVDAEGNYTPGHPQYNGRRIGANHVEGLVKSGALVCVRRFPVNATESDRRNTGREYVRKVDQ